MDSKQELSVLVGGHAWSLADYAPESALLLDLESARERQNRFKAGSKELVLCVCARSSGARTKIAATKCAELLVALNERLTIQLFLLTRPTGGMFAVVFCCVLFDV
jgi:hypothetical protein